MPAKTISSHELDRAHGAALGAAEAGPLFITDNGKPAYVLLSYDAYRKLLSAEPSVLDLLAQPGGEDIEFEPARLEIVIRPADLS